MHKHTSTYAVTYFAWPAESPMWRTRPHCDCTRLSRTLTREMRINDSTNVKRSRKKKGESKRNHTDMVDNGNVQRDKESFVKTCLKKLVVLHECWKKE